MIDGARGWAERVSDTLGGPDTGTRPCERRLPGDDVPFSPRKFRDLPRSPAHAAPAAARLSPPRASPGRAPPAGGLAARGRPSARGGPGRLFLFALDRCLNALSFLSFPYFPRVLKVLPVVQISPPRTGLQLCPRPPSRGAGPGEERKRPEAGGGGREGASGRPALVHTWPFPWPPRTDRSRALGGRAGPHLTLGCAGLRGSLRGGDRDRWRR